MASKNYAGSLTGRPQASHNNHPGQPSQSRTSNPQPVVGAARDLNTRLLHRSVPPPRNRDFMLDMYAQSFDLYNSPFVKAVPASSNTPSDFASRSRSRQATRIKVIGFDGKRVPAGQAHFSRHLDGFFPPVKLRSVDSANQNGRSTRSSNREPSSLGIELAPCTEGNKTAYITQCRASPNSRTEQTATHTMLKPRSPSSKSVKSASSKKSDKSQTHTNPNPVSNEVEHRHFIVKNNSVTHLHQVNNAHASRKNNNFKSESRKNNNMLPSKEVPWIYRYKIKRKMNQLAKIMASQPIPDSEEQSKTTTEYKGDNSSGVFPYMP